MTQSRQGDEPQHPAVRPAHEGVVLPADGSGPRAGEPLPAPPGAQPWDRPWGPQGQASQPPPAAQPQGPQTFGRPLPPENAGRDAEATQFIAPVAGGPGALPPENAGEAARFLGGPGPVGADPTQVLPPVPPAPQDAPYGIRPGAPGDRQPPAEFDSLFRADGPPQPGGETQQLPRFQPSVPLNRPQQQAPYKPPQAPAQQFQPQPQFAAAPAFQEPAGQQSGYEPEAPRRKSPVGLIAAVVVGCAVIGLGAGALLSGGGDSGSKKADQQPAGVSSPAAGDGGGAKDGAADPAKAQAEALDKVLADSGSSRDAVIGAVAEIRACDKLDQAAAALRGAAKQRGDLVTRLGQLSLDKLPDHDKLSGDLTKAWQASAAADDHYAAWADAVAGDKGKNCKDGHAKRNKDAGQGDKASGDATKAKQEASGIWNGIATKYNLTKRGATQL
ncbi:hypothetical protein ACIQ9Q_21760 [Streptomyces sp. NPDC094438]|uniref:hypothetical protein n=1 Tax=Streptomyces sp. NPDC094438 TaxID=3366061 RepID=UPI00380138D9